ncbi:Hypothetical predicted protein [Mytilus galloprovincialis]|uniref:Uncharacterized protein n=1 Tax=Mytilus galloprovincialis TaxID=29158 RepID=A0A8B6BUL9_MYTGA|nr:Hypothetical predicted protein [Mytilus galloprovincialis]
MSEPLQFLLSIEIRNDNHDNGIDIESLIKRASIAIADKAKYKFRVFGEAKIIAIFQVNDDSVVNTVTSDIMKMGPYTVTCTPLCEFDSWENPSGLRNMYNVQITQRILSGEHVVWFEVAYNHGISHEDFDRLWSMNVRKMVNAGRQGLSQTEVFKVLAEKRVYVFSCKLPSETWEAHIQNFKLDKIYKNAKLVTKL